MERNELVFRALKKCREEGDAKEVKLPIPIAVKTVIKALATHCMSYMRKLKGRRL